MYFARRAPITRLGVMAVRVDVKISSIRLRLRDMGRTEINFFSAYG